MNNENSFNWRRKELLCSFGQCQSCNIQATSFICAVCVMKFQIVGQIFKFHDNPYELKFLILNFEFMAKKTSEVKKLWTRKLSGRKI